jgi:hypothetical protein
MDRVEQYHTHTRIVDAYKILPVPVPIGMNLYPCPLGTQQVDQILHMLLTILL